MMTQAERMAAARREFLDAMERGCTISELRAERAELRRRARQAVAERTGDLSTDNPEGASGTARKAPSAVSSGTAQRASGSAPQFLHFDAPWMMRN